MPILPKTCAEAGLSLKTATSGSSIMKWRRMIG
jgi:hypothetical protein